MPWAGLKLTMVFVSPRPRPHGFWPRPRSRPHEALASFSYILATWPQNFFMWYIKWKINMSVVRKTAASWISSAAAKWLFTEMSCYVNSVWLMSVLWYMICNMKVIMLPRPHMLWPRPHRKFLASASASTSHFLASALASSFFGLINKPAACC